MFKSLRYINKLLFGISNRYACELSMSTNQNSLSYSPEKNDEIDLLELCATVWRRRWVIILVMISIIVPTIIWLLLQPSIYKLEVSFDKTSAYDIQPIQPTPLLDGSAYAIEKLETEDFYQTFLIQINSLNTKKLFWKQWSQQPLSRDTNTEVTQNDIAFKKFFNSFTLIPPNPKNANTNFSQLTLETAQPDADAKVLTDYIAFVNNRVVDKFVRQLNKSYSAKLEQLDFDYDTLQKREQQKLEDKLLQLNEWLGIARALKIEETPYEQLTGVELKVVDGREYLLGARVLAEEIKLLEARSEKPLSAFVPELRQMEYSKGVMSNDLKKIDKAKDDVQAFYLASAVVSSVDPVKPKKLLILLGAVFVSGIIGIMVAFILEGMKSYQARSAGKDTV